MTVEHLDEPHLERLLALAEYCREEPEFLPWLQANQPSLYLKASATLRKLAVLAKRVEWRSPIEGVGARPEQLLPGTPGSFSDRADATVWLLMGGRGSGKSHAGAKNVEEILFGREWATRRPKVGLVGQTLDAVRLDMVENKLLPLLPPGVVLKWNRNSCELWLRHPEDRTCIAYLKGFSSEAPRKLRGPEHHLVWADEIGTWKDRDRSPGADDTTWSNMMYGLRLQDGDWQPKAIVTTTPRAVKLIRNEDQDSERDPGPGLYDDPDLVVVSHMSTYDNQANLASSFIKTVVAPKEGTRLHIQEIEGRLLDERQGALWSFEQVQHMSRLGAGWPWRQAGGLSRIVIGVDPSVGAGDGDECGIVVVGKGLDDRAYILADESMRGTPTEWAERVRQVFEEYDADAVVAEVNQGYDLVTLNLAVAAPNMPVYPVVAKKGKKLRAEPVAHLSDQDRVRFACEAEKLKHQMRNWNPEEDNESPDRVDAMVYGVLEILPPHDVGDLMTTRRGGASR